MYDGTRGDERGLVIAGGHYQTARVTFFTSQIGSQTRKNNVLASGLFGGGVFVFLTVDVDVYLLVLDPVSRGSAYRKTQQKNFVPGTVFFLSFYLAL